MIGYVTIGVSNVETAKEFYCGLFEDKGAKVVINSGRMAFIGTKRGEPMLALCDPYDKQAASSGNGVMIAFPAENKDDVSVLYNKALALGATDDGAPGQRIEDRFYGAYVRDADNNKLCFYVFG